MAFIIDDIIKGIGAKKAAKEATRAAEQQSQANYESGVAGETNAEDSRLARANALSTALQGNRALSPEVIQAILQRRQLTTRKGAVQDTSKGAMWNAAGDALGSAGKLAGQYLSGLGVQKIMGGGSNPTTLRPTNSTGMLPGSDFSMRDEWKLR